MVQRSRVKAKPESEKNTVARTEGVLATPGFHPLADFANFGPSEAEMLLEGGTDLEVFTKAIAGSVCEYLVPRLPRLVTGASVDRDVVEEWLTRSSTGPFDEDFADYIRGLTHVGGGTTFPGLSVPLPPQMVIGLIAWLEGEILAYLGDVSDTITLSGVGGIWMDELMLQLGIMLEPVLGSPSGPRDYSRGNNAELHPYAHLAGFGMEEGRTLGETGALLEPAGNGVISLAYSYLLSRPESAGYFQDPEHLAMRKSTLKGWWTRTAGDPFQTQGNFGDYMRKVANAHVKGGGDDPHQEIPAQLTIALMGWVEMRVMTALNTISYDPAGDATFGELGDPGVLADVGKSWMKMLTLQLGVLIDPYLKDSV
jgi:hypothetical protein